MAAAPAGRPARQTTPPGVHKSPACLARSPSRTGGSPARDHQRGNWRRRPHSRFAWRGDTPGCCENCRPHPHPRAAPAWCRECGPPPDGWPAQAWSRSPRRLAGPVAARPGSDRSTQSRAPRLRWRCSAKRPRARRHRPLHWQPRWPPANTPHRSAPRPPARSGCAADTPARTSDRYPGSDRPVARWFAVPAHLACGRRWLRGRHWSSGTHRSSRPQTRASRPRSRWLPCHRPPQPGYPARPYRRRPGYRVGGGTASH